MRIKQLLDIAMQAGEILIKSGAEVYRVEETVARICGAYGIKCECFVLLSGIFMSAESENGDSISLIKRVKGHTIDLTRIQMVNAFSRDLEKETMTYEQAKKTLDGIAHMPRYKFLPRLVMAAFTAYVYTLLFKGNYDEAIAAFVAGILMYSVKELISKAGFFQFFEFFVSGAVAGFMSLLAASFFPGLNIYKIIVGAIIFLVPGMAITNGIKDALYGDIVSSLYRLTEAIFVAAAVGSGVGIVLAVGLPWI